MPERQWTSARKVIPAVAGLLAGGYLVAVFIGPVALTAVVMLAAVAACALVAVRRRIRAPGAVLAAIGLWLGTGFAGAWLLRGAALGGFAWVLLVLYALPLPMIPWLYWHTFCTDTDPAPVDGPRSPVPGPPTPDARRGREA